MTFTFSTGIFIAPANWLGRVGLETAWVEAHTVRLPSLSHSQTKPCDSRHWWAMTGMP